MDFIHEVLYAPVYRTVAPDEFNQNLRNFLTSDDRYGQFFGDLAPEETLPKAFSPLSRVESPTALGRLDFDIEIASECLRYVREDRLLFNEELR